MVPSCQRYPPRSQLRLESPFIISPLKECPFEPESFDVVTLYHSLEHMTNPPKTKEKKIGRIVVDSVIKVGYSLAHALNVTFL
ncbi:MAG: methyltransferase domain-containing protein [Proteobacteria bacterium]|nr:methyltransferase domain-containing protein [Pseudomonadota bacterium]